MWVRGDGKGLGTGRGGVRGAGRGEGTLFVNRGVSGMIIGYDSLISTVLEDKEHLVYNECIIT